MDEHVPEGWAEEVEGDQTRLLHLLNLRRHLSEECGVALKRDIEKSMSSSPSCGVWKPKRWRLRRFLRPPSMRSTSSRVLTVNVGAAVMVGSLMACLLGLAGPLDGLEVLLRDEEDAEVREDQRGREEVMSGTRHRAGRASSA